MVKDKNYFLSILISLIFLACIGGSVTAYEIPRSVPVLLQSEGATCYNPTSLAHKEYVISHLCSRADIMELNIYYDHYYPVGDTVNDVQAWIDTAHNYGMKIALSHMSVPGQNLIAPAIGPNDLTSPDNNTIRPVSGSLGPVGNPDTGIDFGSVPAVNDFCTSLGTFLSKLENLDYYFFDEVFIPRSDWPVPFDDYWAEPPYFAWGTYSDAALEDFRVYVNDITAKFPCLAEDSVFTAAHPNKFEIVGTQTQAEITKWNKWWSWRFYIAGRCFEAVSQAVHEEMESQQNSYFRGVIYFASNRYTYDTAYNLQQVKRKAYGIAIDDVNLPYSTVVYGLASKPHIDVFISEDGGDQLGSSPLGPSTSVQYFKTAAEKYGKAWGNFFQLWKYGASGGTLASTATLDAVLDITTQYNCRMIAAYIDSVFLPEDLPDYNNPYENYSSTISDWWDQHVEPRSCGPLDCRGVRARGFGFTGDLNHDCKIDWLDMNALLQSWLLCNDPHDPVCQ